MKFIIPTQELCKAIDTVSLALSTKPVVNLYENILFVGMGRYIYLTATDGENTISTNVEITDGSSEGSFIVNANSLRSAIKGIPDQPITIDTDDNANMVVTHGTGTMSMPIMSAGDFNAPNVVKDGASAIIDAGFLHRMTEKTRKFVSVDAYRPAVSGVFLNISDGIVECVGTDSHKLSKMTMGHNNNDDNISFIMPLKAASIICTLDDNTTINAVGVCTDGKNVSFSFGYADYTCRIIEGRYPNYNAVIPKDNDKIAIIDSKCLIGALKRVRPFADNTSDIVLIDFDYDKAVVHTEDTTMAKRAKETIMITYNGEPIKIGVKCSNLIEAISNANAANVVISMKESTRPCVIMPETNSDVNNLTMIVMPVVI